MSVHDKDYRENFARSLFLTGKITQETAPTERKFLCSVYVVLLNPEVVNTPQIKRRDPKRDPLKPCVYVGLTGLRVDRYFDYRGVKATPATWPPRKYGIRLMPELYEHFKSDAV